MAKKKTRLERIEERLAKLEEAVASLGTMTQALDHEASMHRPIGPCRNGLPTHKIAPAGMKLVEELNRILDREKVLAGLSQRKSK